MVDYVFGVRLAGDYPRFSYERCNRFGITPDLDMAGKEATLSRSNPPTKGKFICSKLMIAAIYY
jgi:hypothetical protein